MLGQRRTRTNKPLMKQKCIGVDETKRHEFGEASRFSLDLAEELQLIDPVLGCFEMPVHQGRGTANAEAMRSADDFFPLLGCQLVTRENFTHLVIENFRGRSG